MAGREREKREKFGLFSNYEIGGDIVTVEAQKEKILVM